MKAIQCYRRTNSHFDFLFLLDFIKNSRWIQRLAIFANIVLIDNVQRQSLILDVLEVGASIQNLFAWVQLEFSMQSFRLIMKCLMSLVEKIRSTL